MSDESRLERLYVDVRGSGPPIVLTHGLGDSSRTWDALRGALSEFRSVAWDLPGHGRSEQPEEPEAYSRDIALADLKALIDSTWVDPAAGRDAATGKDVVLVGHSLGGYLTQCHAVAQPAGLRALVLIATGPGFSDPERRERWNRYVRRAADRFDIPAAATRLGEQHDDRVMANLAQLDVPVLQICGERDDGYHAAMALLERKVRSVESKLVAGAGHHPHVSHVDEVADTIRKFLARLP